jgi:hypothetical protein
VESQIPEAVQTINPLVYLFGGIALAGAISGLGIWLKELTSARPLKDAVDDD